MQVVGVDEKTLDAMASGAGVDTVLKMMTKLGAMTSEDVLRSGQAPGFTVSEGTAAARLQAFNADPSKVARLRAGDATVRAEYNALIQQKSAAQDAKRHAAN